MSAEPLRILLAGLPRSGTTWVANLLGAAPGARIAVEPDNEKTSLLARARKRGLPRFPVLVPGDPQPAFEALWHSAFGARSGAFLSRSWLTRATMRRGRRAEARVAAKPAPGPRTLDRAAVGLTELPAAPAHASEVRVVKTVHAVLCLDWVCEAARPHRVVIVDRDPRAIIDSWRRLSMPDGTRLWRAAHDWLASRDALPDGLRLDDSLVRMALQAGLMARCLDDFCGRRTGTIRVAHEALCLDPPAGFRALYDRLGLRWTDAVERALQATNRDGEGYRPVRVAHREVGKWQGRYTGAERARVEAVLAAFGLPGADGAGARAT